jgi:hypothetical protein
MNLDIKRKKASLLRLQGSYAEQEILWLERIEDAERLKKNLEANVLLQEKLAEEIKLMEETENDNR